MRKQSKQVIHTQIMHAHRLFLQRAMNWEKMFLSGAITHGQTLQLQYKEKAKTTLRHAEILMDGSVKLDNGIIFARPSQAWSSLGTKSRDYSWLDMVFYQGQSIRDIRAKLTRQRGPKRISRGVAPTKRLRTPTRITRGDSVTPRNRPRYQYSIRPVGRSKGRTQTRPPDTNTHESRTAYVLKHFGSTVAKFDEEERGFFCTCGGYVSLSNNNWKYNVDMHYKSRSCSRLKSTVITDFFKPVQRYTRPDPEIFCLGLYTKTVTIAGAVCDLTLLGEYAHSEMYYVCTKQHSVTMKSGTVEITRSVHSMNCSGHALDMQNVLRPSRNCVHCAGLLQNVEFCKQVLAAQDPRRQDPSSRLPNQYYAWHQLVVQKQKSREQKSRSRWDQLVLLRMRQARVKRRAKVCTHTSRTHKLCTHTSRTHTPLTHTSRTHQTTYTGCSTGVEGWKPEASPRQSTIYTRLRGSCSFGQVDRVYKSLRP